MNLPNGKAVVTGGGSGLGAAIRRALVLRRQLAVLRAREATGVPA